MLLTRRKIVALSTWATFLVVLLLMHTLYGTELMFDEEESPADAPSHLQRLPSFYMYSGRGFDHNHLLDCLPDWDVADSAQYNAELWLYRQLLHHPARTGDASSAAIFVVPIFLHLSFMAGDCAGSTHDERMSESARQLRRSSHFRAKKGWDHLLVSNFWNMERTSKPHLLPLLQNFTVGWFETCNSNPNCPYGWMPARCQVVVPYVQNKFCQIKPKIARPIIAFFRGSADFLHSERGLKVRKQMMKLARDLPGSVIQSVSRKTCVKSKRLGDYGAPGMEDVACFRNLAIAAAEHMMRSLFCLCPRGDTPSTSRFYDAIAAGCIPVVISDEFEIPFSATLDYKGAYIKVPEDEMLRDPASVAKRLASFDAAEIQAMQRQLKRVAMQLDYRDSKKRAVASYLLHTVASQCARTELGNRHGS